MTQEALAAAAEVEVFQISERRRVRPGRPTTSIVWTQVPERHWNTNNLSISNFLTEIRRDQEDQRRLQEDLMKKIASLGRMKRWTTRNPQEIGRVTSAGECGVQGIVVKLLELRPSWTFFT